MEGQGSLGEKGYWLVGGGELEYTCEASLEANGKQSKEERDVSLDADRAISEWEKDVSFEGEHVVELS